MAASEHPVSALLLAVAEQNLIGVAERLALGDDPNEGVQACTPLALAVKQGSLEIVKRLVEGGACPRTCGAHQMTALHCAAARGFKDIAEYLVTSACVDLDAQQDAGCTPLYQAVQHGHVECAKTLIDMKANVNLRTRSGASPLYIAADRGNAELVQVLLDAGSDANARTGVDMTPFLIAAFNGHRGVMECLLRREEDLEQLGPSGGTALYMAAQEGHLETARCLLDHGASVDAKSDGGLTPSLIAAMQGRADMVKLLLSRGGDPGIRSEKGTTLAMMAAQHGQLSVLQAIVELCGAKTLIGERGAGVTALSLARSGKHLEAASFIEGSIAAQQALELAEWEESLPGILADLAPQASAGKENKRKQLQGKSKKRRGEKCLLEKHSGQQTKMLAAPRVLASLSSDTLSTASSVDAKDTDLLGDGTPDVSTGASSDALPSGDESERDWISVRRKSSKNVSCLVDETLSPAAPTLSRSEKPANLASPRQVLIETPPRTPSLRPSLAELSTPCGVRTPQTLWPPTPQSPPALADPSWNPWTAPTVASLPSYGVASSKSGKRIFRIAEHLDFPENSCMHMFASDLSGVTNDATWVQLD
eukprot:TRINITY_DN48381_c0_g1_i1.p1 TRINITY_DN48381_c0_g1~~TRINITY_DN48381_c0_g1_i1.p1  ORF type:complete len:593 (-),score=130.49 TRINITY_DN48381_c0_g1_i1:22-1800(-)